MLNYDDQKELIRCGINTKKIAVIPNGLSTEMKDLFATISTEIPPQNKTTPFLIQRRSPNFITHTIK